VRYNHSIEEGVCIQVVAGESRSLRSGLGRHHCESIRYQCRIAGKGFGVDSSNLTESIVVEAVQVGRG
jgi:hypothetical protein